MKKYITLLNWSHFFRYFITMCCLNIGMGIFILRGNMTEIILYIVFIYPLFILFLPSHYADFYKPQNNMDCLSVIPIKARNITKLQKISKLCMMYIPAVSLTCILLINHNSFGFFIIPNHLLACAAYRLIEKNRDDDFYVVLFLFGVLPFIILFLLETGLWYNFT